MSRGCRFLLFLHHNYQVSLKHFSDDLGLSFIFIPILLIQDLCHSEACFFWERYTKILIFILQMILVIVFIIAVIMYRVLIAIPLFQSKELRSNATMIASGSAAVVNLILIMALGKVYEKLALKLTQWGRYFISLWRIKWKREQIKVCSLIKRSRVILAWLIVGWLWNQY